MKILVTGATGFIGSHVVEALLKDGHEVVATSTNLEKARLASWYEQVTYVTFDISQQGAASEERASLYDYFHQPDQLIHLAWEGVSDCAGMVHIERNLISHYRFLKKMVEGGLTRIAVTGTCLEYGFKTGMLSETDLPEPHVSYAIAKDALRRFLMELQKKMDFSIQWVRLFYMYGKGQHSRSLLAQLETAIKNGDESFNMSGGEQERDYLPVEKVAEYLVAIASKGKKNEVYNCCSGTPISVRQLVEDIIAAKGSSIKLNLGFYPYKDYEPMRFWGNTNKLKSILA